MVQSSQLLAAALGAGLAYVGPAAFNLAAPELSGLLTSLPLLERLPLLLSSARQTNDSTSLPSAAREPYDCPADQGYRTELVSLDPLLVYIHDFVSPREAALVIRAGETLLQPSPVTGYGGDASATQARTSWSAPLPDAADDAAVACVLRRAESFLGTLLRPGRDDMGAAQLVHYDNGQKFDLHHDWFRQPRLADADAAAGRRRLYNRLATFFVVLQANCTAGETYFPQAGTLATRQPRDEAATGPGAPESGSDSGSGRGSGRGSGGSSPPIWRAHEKGGLAFRPVAGNALFWVNLFANGTGDTRTLHAGLPVGEGTKTAMNIWPRTYFGPDA